jgi:hypothetical protein
VNADNRARSGAGESRDRTLYPLRVHLNQTRRQRGVATDLGSLIMAGMDDRKDAFEKKFAHDEELLFKASARRNKMVGLWAAELLGKSGAEAEAYAKSVVMADFEEAGDDDVLRKIKADLSAGGIEQSDHQIRRTMDELMAKAVDEIKAKG